MSFRLAPNNLVQANVINTSSNPVPITVSNADSAALPIKIADGINLDAFDRLRVSDVQTIFDSKMISDNQPLAWDDSQTSGSGTTSTFNTNQASSTLAVSASTAGTRVRQTKRYFNYQSGKSQLIIFTGIFGTGGTGIIKRYGYFNDNDGLFFQQSGTTFSIVIRSNITSSPVDTVVNKSDWNVDKMDGTGTSGITLDITKAQIFLIDFQWLGAGRIRYGFVIDGIIYYCHYINNANNLTTVYMSNPNLPMRGEIINDGTGGVNSITHICFSIGSESGEKITGIVRAIERTTAITIPNSTNHHPVLAIRLKSSYLHATIRTVSASIVPTAAADYVWRIWLNPTVGGTALSFTNVTNSSVQQAIGVPGTTLTDETGTVLFSSFQTAANNSSSGVTDVKQPLQSLNLGSFINGDRDILVFSVRILSGTNKDFYGSLAIRETF